MAKVVALGPMFCLGESRKAGEEFEMSEVDAKSHETAGLVFVGSKVAFDKKKAEAEKATAEADAKTKAEAIANAEKQAKEAEAAQAQ